jgi:peptidoglycan/LPS O-acetylase OafA/YrhL
MTTESIAGRQDRLVRANGFDAMRLALSVGILAFHSVTISTGGTAPIAPIVQAAARLILPGFFAISGYLVTASLDRCKSPLEFLALRALRILPALSVVIIFSALLLGPLLTALPLHDYFRDPALAQYFRNILAWPRYALPGVFLGNPRAGVVNGALWTIQLEMGCYGVLAALALLSRGRLLTWALLAAALGLLAAPVVPWWMAARELPLAFALGALLYRLARLMPHHPLMGLLCLGLALALARDPARMALAALPLAYGVLWLGLRRIPAWLTRADYSYGVYLVGYPLEQVWVHFFPAAHLWWADFLFAAPLALLVAGLLWHGLEKPLLSRKRRIIAGLGTRLTARKHPAFLCVAETKALEGP